MASVVDKQSARRLEGLLVRYRTADGEQRSKQFKRNRDADAYVNLAEVDRQHGALIDPRLGRITIGEWWDRWWPTVTNLRPSTRARDEQFFRTHVRPDVRITPIGKLDRTALRAWVAEPRVARGTNLAPATIHRVVQLLNKCMNVAFEDRLIAHNPVAQLPLPRIERREMRFLDTDDIWKLADEIDEAYRSFVLLGAFGGLRLGEMLGLRWKRVDLLRRRVDIAETLVSIGGHITFGPPKTKAAVRTVPLPRSSATSCLAAPPRGTPNGWSSSRPRDSRSGRRSSAALLASCGCRRRTLTIPYPRSPTHRRLALGRRRSQPQARRCDGRSHIGLCRVGPIRPPLPATGRRTNAAT